MLFVRWLMVVVLGTVSVACNGPEPGAGGTGPVEPYVAVLGVVQDGGAPHIGCEKPCCQELWPHPEAWQRVVSLGLVDPTSGERWLIEATPDLPVQLQTLLGLPGCEVEPVLKGVFVTHAHIGHYPGLMYFGREAQGAAGVPVFHHDEIEEIASFVDEVCRS